MHKKKDVKTLHTDDQFDDEFDDVYEDENEPFQDKTLSKFKTSYRHKHRLQIKKRMDDYEEFLWKKRNGWFDDELYSFNEDDTSPKP